MGEKKKGTKSTKSVTEVVIDSSGSVKPELLKGFLNQLKPLVNKTDLKVGFFDIKFYGFNEINNVSDLDNLKLQGGLGTDINCAIDALTKGDKVNKIIFTDGLYYDDIKDKEKFKNDQNLTWIIFDEQTFNAPFGKTIFADSKKIIQQYQQANQPANNNQGKANVKAASPYKFATNVKEADIEALEKAVVDAENTKPNNDEDEAEMK